MNRDENWTQWLRNFVALRKNFQQMYFGVGKHIFEF